MENQILDLEKKYWEGMENHNYETVKSLTHFPCIIAGKQGVSSVDEASFKKMFDSGAGKKMKVAGITEVQSKTFDDQSAVIAYIIELSGDGQNAPMKCACTSTWIRENNNWVCTMHTESDLMQ